MIVWGSADSVAKLNSLCEVLRASCLVPGPAENLWGRGPRHFQKTEIKWKNVCSLWCNHLCPGLTSACRLECQVHVSACQEPVAVPGVCTCVGFRELCILAAAAATFHSDILHPFNICVFMWTSWLRSLRLPTLWHRLIRFSTAVSCSSKLIQLRLTWDLKLVFFFFFFFWLFCLQQNLDVMNPQAAREDLAPNHSELRLYLITWLIFHLQSRGESVVRWYCHTF